MAVETRRRNTSSEEEEVASSSSSPLSTLLQRSSTSSSTSDLSSVASSTTTTTTDTTTTSSSSGLSSHPSVSLEEDDKSIIPIPTLSVKKKSNTIGSTTIGSTTIGSTTATGLPSSSSSSSFAVRPRRSGASYNDLPALLATTSAKSSSSPPPPSSKLHQHQQSNTATTATTTTTTASSTLKRKQHPPSSSSESSSSLSSVAATTSSEDEKIKPINNNKQKKNKMDSRSSSGSNISDRSKRLGKLKESTTTATTTTTTASRASKRGKTSATATTSPPPPPAPAGRSKSRGGTGSKAKTATKVTSTKVSSSTKKKEKSNKTDNTANKVIPALPPPASKQSFSDSSSSSLSSLSSSSSLTSLSSSPKITTFSSHDNADNVGKMKRAAAVSATSSANSTTAVNAPAAKRSKTVAASYSSTATATRSSRLAAKLDPPSVVPDTSPGPVGGTKSDDVGTIVKKKAITANTSSAASKLKMKSVSSSSTTTINSVADVAAALKKSSGKTVDKKAGGGVEKRQQQQQQNSTTKSTDPTTTAAVDDESSSILSVGVEGDSMDVDDEKEGVDVGSSAKNDIDLTLAAIPEIIGTGSASSPLSSVASSDRDAIAVATGGEKEIIVDNPPVEIDIVHPSTSSDTLVVPSQTGLVVGGGGSSSSSNTLGNIQKVSVPLILPFVPSSPKQLATQVLPPPSSSSPLPQPQPPQSNNISKTSNPVAEDETSLALGLEAEAAAALVALSPAQKRGGISSSSSQQEQQQQHVSDNNGPPLPLVRVGVTDTSPVMEVVVGNRENGGSSSSSVISGTAKSPTNTTRATKSISPTKAVHPPSLSSASSVGVAGIIPAGNKKSGIKGISSTSPRPAQQHQSPFALPVFPPALPPPPPSSSSQSANVLTTVKSKDLKDKMDIVTSSTSLVMKGIPKSAGSYIPRPHASSSLSPLNSPPKSADAILVSTGYKIAQPVVIMKKNSSIVASEASVAAVVGTKSGSPTTTSSKSPAHAQSHVLQSSKSSPTPIQSFSVLSSSTTKTTTSIQSREILDTHNPKPAAVVAGSSSSALAPPSTGPSNRRRLSRRISESSNSNSCMSISSNSSTASTPATASKALSKSGKAVADVNIKTKDKKITPDLSVKRAKPIKISDEDGDEEMQTVTLPMPGRGGGGRDAMDVDDEEEESDEGDDEDYNGGREGGGVEKRRKSNAKKSAMIASSSKTKRSAASKAQIESSANPATSTRRQSTSASSSRASSVSLSSSAATSSSSVSKSDSDLVTPVPKFLAFKLPPAVLSSTTAMTRIAHVQKVRCVKGSDFQCRECRRKGRPGACQFMYFRAFAYNNTQLPASSSSSSTSSSSSSPVPLLLDWSLLNPQESIAALGAATDGVGGEGTNAVTNSAVPSSSSTILPTSAGEHSNNHINASSSSSLVPGRAKYIQHMIAPTLKAFLELEVDLLRSSSAATFSSIVLSDASTGARNSGGTATALAGCALIDLGGFKWDQLTGLLLSPSPSPPPPPSLSSIVPSPSSSSSAIYPTIYRRPHIDGLRQLCDVCETSIFNSCWTCGLCAIEVCTLCFEEWNYPPSMPPLVEKKNKLGGFCYTFARHGIAMCSKNRLHVKAEFVRVYRLPVPELASLVSNVDQYLQQSSLAPPRSQQQQQRLGPSNSSPTSSSVTVTSSLSSPAPPLPTISSAPRPVVNLEAESDHLPSFQVEEITLDSFRRHWKRGEPVAVRDIKMSRDWSSQFFEENFGDEVTDLVNCMTGETVENWTVGQFFKEFRTRPVAGSVKRKRSRPSSSGGGESSEDGFETYDALKFKDWPSNMHFKEKLPLHYADFHKSIPLSDYHSMDGEFNLVSKLPDTMNIPDLGPKMYVAHGMAHNWSPVGTTSLHLDMADAVNILVHVQDPSSSKSSGNNNGNSPPSSVVGAVWDIFPQDSLSVLRAFLKQECPDDYTDDPVHDQIIFLNRGLLRKLYNTHGIRPWRLYQRPGTAIFVPAGCAHQVYNLAHCVKVAVDFVSPEHVGACVRIMNEFRLLPRGHARKQDLLQIKAILWHAWKSFDSDGMIDKAAAKEEAEKAVEEIRRRRLNGGGVVGLDVSEYAPPPAFSSIRSSSSLSLSYVRPVSAPTSTSTTLAAVGEEGKEDGGASTRAVKSSKRRVKSANHALSSSSTAKTMAAKTSIAPLHKKPAIGGAVSGGNGKLSAGGGVVNYSNSDVEEEDEILTEDEEARVMARGSGSGSGTSKLVFPASSSSDTTRTTTTSWNARLLSPTKPITAPKLNRAKLSSTASIKPAALKGNEEVNGSIPPHLSPLPRAPPSDPHRSIAPPTTQESQSHLGQNDTTANTNDVICNGDEQLGEGKNDEDDLEDLENDLGGYGEGLNLIDGYFK